MTTYFITRHPGAIDWAKQQGIQVDQQLNHLDTSIIQKGDTVLGTLPVNLIAEVCERGGHYYHLILELAPEMRGKELTAEDMQNSHARLEEYNAKKIHTNQEQ